MAFPMKENKAFNPADVRLFGALGEALEAHESANLIEQKRIFRLTLHVIL